MHKAKIVVVSVMAANLVDKSLNLHLTFSNPVRFVPMYFGSSDVPVGKFDVCRSFEFPPPTRAELFLQPGKLANSVANCYGFDVLDVSLNLEVHSPVLDCGGTYSPNAAAKPTPALERSERVSGRLERPCSAISSLLLFFVCLFLIY
jgi:hypothetical protein